MKKTAPRIAFFGGQPLGVPVLEKLIEADIVPDLVVCNPDRPAGRGQKITTPPLKDVATIHDVPVFQPDSYADPSAGKTLTEKDWDLFIVVAYNFILPNWLLQIPAHGVVNVHPSLLPKLRGASPIRTAIKHDLRDYVGVSIMLMDEKMDHGPILAQQTINLPDADWPLEGPLLDNLLATSGGELLVQTVPLWLQGEITPRPQNHSHATYCTRLTRADAELVIDPKHLPSGIEARAALHHIYAFQGIGDSYFIYQNKRIKIKQATIAEDGSLQLLRVIPAGKSEIDFDQFLQIID